MPSISEFYASPGLRVGLLLEDHPDATYDFRMVTGDEVGVPNSYGGSKQFCLCTITFASGRAPVSAWKPVPDKGTPDDWNVLCTKTLGRALKRAGYPDDLKDLKALVLWRQRDAEIAAIKAGTLSSDVRPVAAIEASPENDPMQQALTAAATTDAEAVGHDEVDYETGEIIEAPSTDADTVAMVKELVGGLTAAERKNWQAYCKTVNLPDVPEMTDDELSLALTWLEPEGM